MGLRTMEQREKGQRTIAEDNGKEDIGTEGNGTEDTIDRREERESGCWTRGQGTRTYRTTGQVGTMDIRTR